MVKQRRTLMILVVGLLMISLVVGGLGGVISKDKTIPSRDINSTERATLLSKGIGAWDYEDVENEETITRNLKTRSSYNLPSIEVPTYYLNCIENETLNDSWHETTYEDVVNKSDEFGRTYEVPNGTIYHENFLILGCKTYERINYTSQELEAMLDLEMIKTMKELARVIDIRNKTLENELVREGGVVVSNR